MTELIQNKDICRKATFLKQVLLHSNNIFRKDTFSRKVLFKRGTFSRGDIILNIIISSVLYHCFSEKLLFGKANFSEKQYSALPTLSGEPLFQSGWNLTFHSRYFFRRAAFQSILFKKRYYFTAMFPFYSSLPIHHLVIKWAPYQFHTVKVWGFFLSPVSIICSKS